MKEKDPNIKIIGIDPIGSVLSIPESLNVPGPEGGKIVEGIGKDYIPRVMDRSLVDKWIKVGDGDGFKMARRLMIQEGLLVGSSSGTAMYGAI